MKLSDAGTEFIANFEGFRADPYWDIDHHSIGYGTRAKGENDGPITREEGLRRLHDQVEEHYGAAVNKLNDDFDLGLNQNQFDALVSFVYNLGPAAIGKDWDVGQALRAKDFQRAADEMLDHNKAGGQVLAGLTTRREKERALFLKRPPVGYTDDERHLLSVIKDENASKTRRLRAATTLRAQATEIQKKARAEKDGWKKHDRGRRFQGIRRALKRYAPK